ncbi:MAG: tRNA lysidine(34) synthetase TilS [Clostridia bacterium]|nr:tRNA lysidine(34) synthetase TilS [Clostridia bacterium]
MNLDMELLKNRGVVAVAVSGGKDSVALIHLLSKLKGELGITLKAVNVEHGIRGEESVSDSEFVKKLCKELSVELYFKSVDVPRLVERDGLSEEEAARILRYKVFDEAIESGFCDFIATAHHLSDDVETILFNILRGTSLSGVGGISSLSHGGKILRPMLSVTRDEIDDYVLKNNLPFVTDRTNFDTGYARNFLRLEVIPLIKSRFKSFETAVERFAVLAAKDDEYLNCIAKKSVELKDGEASFAVGLDEIIFARSAVVAMKHVGIVKDYEKRHIDEISALKDARNGTTIDLPKNVAAVKDYDKITLYIKKGRDSEEAPFKTGEMTVCGKRVNISLADKIEKKDKTLYFDGDKVPRSAVIRTRRDGDTFEKFSGGTKKLKDYLIDKKIPSRERDGLLLVADGKKVLLIFGIEISASIKVDKGTTNMLKCNISNNT